MGYSAKEEICFGDHRNRGGGSAGASSTLPSVRLPVRK